MRKTTTLGSSHLPCLETLTLDSHGEFDVNVRELVRILNLSGPRGQREGGVLAPTTIDHMYELLAARGALSDDAYSVTTGCGEPAGDEVGSPEDTADRHAWYRELGRFLGDLFEWLAKTYVEYSLLSGVGGQAVMPFLLITPRTPRPAARDRESSPDDRDVALPDQRRHHRPAGGRGL